MTRGYKYGEKCIPVSISLPRSIIEDINLIKINERVLITEIFLEFILKYSGRWKEFKTKFKLNDRFKLIIKK